MLTKKLWLVVAIVAFLILGLRISFYYNSKQTEGNITVKGQVLTEPYLRKGEYNFRVDRFQVVTKYQNISFGDNVLVEGELRDRVIRASKVLVLPQTGIEGFLTKTRLGLNRRLLENFPSPQSQLLSGIVLGVKSNLNKDFKQSLVNTGTLHVVVVSGYNIALVAGFGLSLSFLIGRRKASLFAGVLVIVYTLLVGVSAPTLRATIMALLTIAGTLFGRQVLAGYLLFLTAYLLILISPENLVDVSFQLTFLATLGLIIFSNPFSNYLGRLPRQLREPLATTLAAQVLVVPIIFFYFGNVPLLSPLINILVLWTVPLITVAGFLYLFLLQVSILLAHFLGYLLLVPLTFFVQVVVFFGKFDSFVFQSERGNWLVISGYLLLLLALLIVILRRNRGKELD